ncbi:MAG: D-glycero-alpha-D-manno-heptose-1,7-bisphosphate 7-phosphatase [Planctomycetia bacterium]
MKHRKAAVFLDRDGTLSEEIDWVRRPEDLHLIPGAAKAVKRLSEAGYFVALVTNQSAVARGLISIEQLEAIHAHLQQLLAFEGARLDAIAYCPHHPTEGMSRWKLECECRKPKDGLLRELIARHGLDPAQSFVIGDARRDLEAGASLGIPGILVRTGKGRREEALLTHPVIVADALPEAVERIVGSTAQGR